MIITYLAENLYFQLFKWILSTCALFAFTQGFKSPEYNILLRVTRFSYYNIAIWLSACETVRAACFMWAACITTIHAAVSQTKWILCRSEIEHISPKARDNCASYTSVIILSRNTVWSCSFLFIWQNEFVDSDCLLQPLHAREFYFKTTLTAEAKKPAVHDSTDICSHSQAISVICVVLSVLEGIPCWHHRFESMVSQQFRLCCCNEAVFSDLTYLGKDSVIEMMAKTTNIRLQMYEP